MAITNMARSRRPSRSVLYLRWTVLGFGALGVLFPILIFVSNSLKTNAEFVINPLGLPAHLTLRNYAEAWDKANMGRLILNSFVVSIISTVLAILLSSMLAFGIHAFRFRGRNALLASIVMMLTIPAQIYIIPLYLVVIELHLVNSYGALIFPYAAGSMPLALVLFRNYFSGLPSEVMDAARIDGSRSLDIYWRIVMPLSRPVIGAVAVFSFVSAWNEFFLALVFVQNKALYTLPLGMQMFATSEYSTNFTLLFAAFSISMLPMILVYLLMQRQFIAGIAGGALKG